MIREYMHRGIQMEKKEKKVIAILFAVCLAIGLIAVQGYGINVDENPEIDIARMDLKEYVRLFFGENSRLFTYMDHLIGDLMDSVEIDHGEAVLYPIVAAVSVLRAMGRADLGMLSYHMYLYIWFLLGLLAAYGVGKFLTGKKWYGAMAAAFIGLNPMLFGNAFINNKDMIMLSLTSICIYFGIQFVEKKTWQWSVLWAVITGLCVNMRITGLMYAGLFGGLYLLEFLVSPEKDKKVFWHGILAILVMLATFVAATPATWYSFWGYFVYTAGSSVGFLRWHGWELYAGELYRYLEKSLPWHYFFGCFGIQTPIIFLLAFIAGQAGCVRLLFEKLKQNWKYMKYMLVFAAIIWVPMIFFMIRSANVTFRHFFFMYPLLAFMAVYALHRFCDQRKAERIVKGCVVLQSVICVLLIILGHPFQATYFNVLAGRNADERFEYINMDYYKEALEQILKMDERNDILISSDNLNCYFGIKQAWEILHPDKKARIRIAEPETAECRNADYHVYGHSALIKENKEAKLGIEDAVFCEPEKRFNGKLGLDAYGKRVITIYFDQ